MACLHGMMVASTLASTKMIKNMDTVSFNGLMAAVTTVNGSKESSMEKVFT